MISELKKAISDDLLLKIKLRRKKLGFSQKSMAEKLNLTQAGYGKMETGKTNVTLDYLLEISEILNKDFFKYLSMRYNNEFINPLP